MYFPPLKLKALHHIGMGYLQDRLIDPSMLFSGVRLLHRIVPWLPLPDRLLVSRNPQVKLVVRPVRLLIGVVLVAGLTIIGWWFIRRRG